MKNFKLQFWSFDVVFAIVIFSVALVIMAATWYDISAQLSLSTSGGATLMQLQTETLATSFLSTGSPTYWEGIANLSNVSTWNNVGIGISNANGSISSKKLYTFLAMATENYQATKQPLGVAYDYYITIYNSNMNISMGRNPAAYRAVTVDVDTKSSYINGEPVTVKFMLWSNNTIGVS